MKNQAINEMAVKAAFFNLDFGIDAGFYEVMNCRALDRIARDAQKLVEKAGFLKLKINRYTVAEVLWGMNAETVDYEIAEIEGGR